MRPARVLEEFKDVERLVFIERNKVASPTIVKRPLLNGSRPNLEPFPNAVPGERERFCQAFTGVAVERFLVNVVKLLRVYGG